MSNLAIEAKNIHKSFGKLRALSGVDLGVEKGTICGLLGPNGAGKTTLVRILTTLMLPDVGTATVAGKDVAAEPQAVRGLIGLAGQYAAVDEILTGRENLIMVGRLYNLSIKEAAARAQQLLIDFDLVDAADRILKTYSGGMRRRLDLAASIVNRPLVLFLDEPTAGLDPASRLVLWRIIGDLKKTGTTILLTTQYMEEADHLADTIVVIDRGKVVARGTSEELKSKVGGDVIEIHLRDSAQVETAAQVLRPIGNGNVDVNAELGLVRVPVENSADALQKAVRALDQSHVPLEDLQLRKPTLDEAFLKLTGHRAEML